LDPPTLLLKLVPLLQTPILHKAPCQNPFIFVNIQSRKSEIDGINHRREVLLQNFPEDQPVELFTNPILIEDDGDEDIISLQRSEEAQWELVLQFVTYRGYNM
jgi:hypothetical protein